MTKTNLLTVFVVTFVVAMLGIAPITPVFAVPVLNPANGNIYELISTTLSWTDAKSAAEAAVFLGENGHLVTITSADENAFVEGLVPDNQRVWIGLTDEVTEGTFQWVTGEPVIYTNWGPGEPNDAGSGEDYAEFLADPPFIGSPWNDVPNVLSVNNGYVVEYDTGLEHIGILDQLNEILDEVKEIWSFLQDEVLAVLLSTETTVNNINNEITDPEHGLAEIKREVRNIESSVTNPEFGLEEIKREVSEIELKLEDQEEVSVRDNLFVTDVHLMDGQVMVLLDNAGIGGSSDVEVTWRLDDKKCLLLYTLTDVAAGLSLTPFVDGGALGGNPAHQDLTGVEAIALTTQEKKNCHVNPTQGEYIGISTIGSTP